MGQAKQRGTYEDRVAEAVNNLKKVGILEHAKREPSTNLFLNLIPILKNNGGGTITARYAHLEPTEVITDTIGKYEAIYTDEGGDYTFSISRNGNNYCICADGVKSSTTDIDYILHNFEVQLSVYGPKVLGGRTFKGQGMTHIEFA